MGRGPVGSAPMRISYFPPRPLSLQCWPPCSPPWSSIQVLINFGPRSLPVHHQSCIMRHSHLPLPLLRLTFTRNSPTSHFPNIIPPSHPPTHPSPHPEWPDTSSFLALNIPVFHPHPRTPLLFLCSFFYLFFRDSTHTPLLVVYARTHPTATPPFPSPPLAPLVSPPLSIPHPPPSPSPSRSPHTHPNPPHQFSHVTHHPTHATHC